jgi:hypothetical protein
VIFRRHDTATGERRGDGGAPDAQLAVERGGAVVQPDHPEASVAALTSSHTRILPHAGELVRVWTARLARP